MTRLATRSPIATAIAMSISVAIAGCASGPGGQGADGRAASPATLRAPTALPTSVATTSTTTASTPGPTSTSTTSTTSTTTTSTSTTTTSTTSSTTTTTTTLPPPTETACRRVAYLGDSTSVGIDGETGTLGDDDDLGGRLAAVGVDSVAYEVSGGRAIVERLEGQESGAEVAARLASTGFDGCWVVALGTNDAANIAAGASAGVRDRVDSIMSAVGDQPVVWFDAATVRTDGFWATTNMATWNAELDSALADHPNASLAEWSEVVSPGWFVSDGIHPNAEGLRVRAELTASLLLFLHPSRSSRPT